MPLHQENCADTMELIYIHYADDNEPADKFPCICRKVHPGNIPGSVERVSRATVGEPSNGDAMMCPEGHVMIFDRHRFMNPGSSPQDTYGTGWLCSDESHDYFVEFAN